MSTSSSKLGKMLHFRPWRFLFGWVWKLKGWGVGVATGGLLRASSGWRSGLLSLFYSAQVIPVTNNHQHQ